MIGKYLGGSKTQYQISTEGKGKYYCTALVNGASIQSGDGYYAQIFVVE